MYMLGLYWATTILFSYISTVEISISEEFSESIRMGIVIEKFNRSGQSRHLGTVCYRRIVQNYESGVQNWEVFHRDFGLLWNWKNRIEHRVYFRTIKRPGKLVWKVPFSKKKFILNLNRKYQKQFPIRGYSTSTCLSVLPKCLFVKKGTLLYNQRAVFL